MSRSGTILLVICLALAFVLTAGCTQSAPAAAQATPAATTSVTQAAEVTPAAALVPSGNATTPATALAGKKVRLETTMGNITIALDPDMPITAGNFETLVSKGYYDGVIFHRVIDGFMIQGGDPTGTGRGGPGYSIPDEFTSHNQNVRGTIAMANAGPNTGGSQFFINLVDNNRLDTKHPVFGNVIEGMDVVDAIGKVQTSGYPNDRPLQNVTIVRAVLV